MLEYLGIPRAAAWGRLTERLLCCKGSDWNPLEINPLHLADHSSARQAPDGAAMYISFILLHWHKDNWRWGRREPTCGCPSWGEQREEISSARPATWNWCNAVEILQDKLFQKQLPNACVKGLLIHFSVNDSALFSVHRRLLTYVHYILNKTLQMFSCWFICEINITTAGKKVFALLKHLKLKIPSQCSTIHHEHVLNYDWKPSTPWSWSFSINFRFLFLTFPYSYVRHLD